MAGLALDELRALLRAERRRKRREQATARHEAGEDASQSGPFDMRVDELCASLTPPEQEFSRRHLLGQQPQGEPSSLEAANVRQMTRRVRRKLVASAGA